MDRIHIWDSYRVERAATLHHFQRCSATGAYRRSRFLLLRLQHARKHLTDLSLSLKSQEDQILVPVEIKSLANLEPPHRELVVGFGDKVVECRSQDFQFRVCRGLFVDIQNDQIHVTRFESGFGDPQRLGG